MPTLQHILVPFDYSPAAEAALGLAADLARACGARLLVVHFLPFEVRSLGDYPVVKGDPESIADETERLRAQVAHLVDGTGQRPEVEAMWSGPSLHIVETAIERNIDLIVMGTHGRSAAKHVVLGGVAERTMRLAPCPVVTVRGPATTLAEGVREARHHGHDVGGMMSRDPVTVAPDDDLSVAAGRMTEADVRHLPVVEAGELVGILSALDLPAHRGRFASTRVRTAMTPDPITIAADAPVAAAARLMLENRVRALPVVEGARVIGILSSTDILEDYVRAAREEA